MAKAQTKTKPATVKRPAAPKSGKGGKPKGK